MNYLSLATIIFVPLFIFGGGSEVNLTGEEYAVSYNLNTGEITSVILTSYDLLQSMAQFYPERGYGIYILENYTDAEKETIFDKPWEYIFDIQVGRVRKATEKEIAAIRERLEQERVVNILRSIETLPDNRIRATLSWLTYHMYVETNSSVLGVKLDSTNMQLFIEVSGTSGTSGLLDLVVPRELVPSLDDIRVYLDGSPIDFTLDQVKNYYLIHVEYTHSTHTLTVNLIALPAWYAQPLNLALIALAIVAAIGTVYWFRFRR